MIVRCTARLLELLAQRELDELPAAPDDWYANLVWIDRRKCLLVVHSDTLFPLFVPDVRKPELANLGRYLADKVSDALAAEGLASDCLGPLDPAGLRIARTASRSVLGSMNEMASTSRYVVARAGGLAQLDPAYLNALLRRMPCNRDGYFRPIDAARLRARRPSPG